MSINLKKGFIWVFCEEEREITKNSLREVFEIFIIKVEYLEGFEASLEEVRGIILLVLEEHHLNS